MNRTARSILPFLLCSALYAFAQQPAPPPAVTPAPPTLTHAEQVALNSILQKEGDLSTQFREQEQVKAQIVGDINQEHPAWVFDPNTGFIAKQEPKKPEAPKPDAAKK
jgi:hypothetical protein